MGLLLLFPLTLEDLRNPQDGPRVVSLTLLLVILALAPWVFVGTAFWLMLQLIRQNGRILLSLEAVHAKLRELAPDTVVGLPLGVLAPAFELPDQDGNLVSLKQFAGREILLIFWTPLCTFCEQMAPALAKLPVDGRDGRPIPVLVTTDDPDESRLLAEQFGLRCLQLVDRTGTVSDAYKSTGTPSGYLIDARGFVASDLARGADALLALTQVPASSDNDRDSGAADVRAIRVPIKGLSPQGIGLGDAMKRLTNAVGLKTCPTCDQRRQRLNRWVIKGMGNATGSGSKS